jgi:hypothetical protein
MKGICGATLTPTGMPASASASYGAQAPVGRCGARLHAAGQLRIERGDGDVHRRQALCGHGREQIQVALHAAALGDERKRVARLAASPRSRCA